MLCYTLCEDGSGFLKVRLNVWKWVLQGTPGYCSSFNGNQYFKPIMLHVLTLSSSSSSSFFTGRPCKGQRPCFDGVLVPLFLVINLVLILGFFWFLIISNSLPGMRASQTRKTPMIFWVDYAELRRFRPSFRLRLVESRGFWLVKVESFCYCVGANADKYGNKLLLRLLGRYAPLQCHEWIFWRGQFPYLGQ